MSERQAGDEMQYRADIAFSCALTGMVTAFALHLEDLVKAGNKVGLENLLYLGFLVQQESLQYVQQGKRYVGRSVRSIVDVE